MNLQNQNISSLLTHLKQKQFTGKIIIQSDSKVIWYIYLCLGRLVWIDGGIHPNRAWYRLINKYCSHVNWQELELDNLNWFESKEYRIVNLLLQKKLIVSSKTIELISRRVAEALFDILQSEARQTLNITSEIASASSFLVSASTRSSSLIDVEELLSSVRQDWSSWQQKGLQTWSPNLAPAIQKHDRLREEVAAVVYQNFAKLFDGQRTLRDLSVLMNKNIAKLTFPLLPYIRQGLIDLLTVEDINHVLFDSKLVNSQQTTNVEKPLIACIDDSPQICRIMEQILTYHGYRSVSIQESLQALPTLIKTLPALIFLDIGMPGLNGYELCSQIRKVSKLKDIPIVILTGNDGIVDRVRAKVVGANAFVGKPIEIDKIINAIEKNLDLSSSTGSDSSPNLNLASN